jgi:endonuclease/exonuclease/phosphatase (EEP) superfamily protein YafD
VHETPVADKRGKGGGRIVCWICVLYLLAALAGWVLLKFGDDWWPATFLLFAPRWLLAVPLAALAPLAAWRHPRSLLVLIAAGVVVLGPVMGLVIPWERLWTSVPEGTRLRVLSCNMHYARYDAAPLDELIGTFKPDIVVLQEWHRDNHAESLKAPDWHMNRTAALFIASRFPIKRTQVLGRYSMDPEGAVASHELAWPATASAGPLTVFNLHLASPRHGLAKVADDQPGGADSIIANSELRQRQSRFIAEQARRVNGPLLLAGDFNTPTESVLFRTVWQEQTDAFSTAGLGWGYTFVTRTLATRIDHILLGKGWHCMSCRVGPSVGSPHRPVLAELVWPR